MSDDGETLVRRLIGGDAAVWPELVDHAATATAPSVLVAAAFITRDADDLLARAASNATTTRDRQLVAIATAHLDGDHDLLELLVRDHLADHPDHVFAAWIAALDAGNVHPTPTNAEERP